MTDREALPPLRAFGPDPLGAAQDRHPTSASAARLLDGRFRMVRREVVNPTGAIWSGTDDLLRRPVWIAFLHRRLLRDPARRARFKDRLTAAARLSHPNVVAVLDCLTVGDTLAVITAVPRGHCLRDLLRDGPLPIDEALRVARGVSQALEHAHTADTVHGWLCPEAVWVGATDVQVWGFGWYADEDPLDLELAPYLAPERLTGGRPDEPGDHYGLGVLLYECLAGTAPFVTRPLDLGVLSGKLVREPPPVRWARPQVPRALDELVSRLLSRDPSARTVGVSDP